MAIAPEQRGAEPGSSRQGRRSGTALVVLGALLVVAAVGLLVWRETGSVRSGMASARVLEQLDQWRPATPVDADTSHLGANTPVGWEEPGGGAMPVVRVDGSDYVGSLAIPVLDLELPVCATLDDAHLVVSPCCFMGSYLTDDLVICGEGYASQFGGIGTLGIKDEVRFVSADGVLHRYIVSNVEREPVEEIDRILDDWDLTLFTFNADDTCTVVRCIRPT